MERLRRWMSPQACVGFVGTLPGVGLVLPSVAGTLDGVTQRGYS